MQKCIYREKNIRAVMHSYIGLLSRRTEVDFIPLDPSMPVDGLLRRRRRQPLHLDDVIGLPRLVEKRLEWPKKRKRTNQPFPAVVWIQLFSLPAGAVGPKWISIEPSAFACGPVYVLTEGKGWSLRRIDRLFGVVGHDRPEVLHWDAFDQIRVDRAVENERVPQLPCGVTRWIAVLNSKLPRRVWTVSVPIQLCVAAV
jgi:hypothetical protein